MDKEFEILWRGILAMGKVNKAQAALEAAQKEAVDAIEDLRTFDGLRSWVRGELS